MFKKAKPIWADLTAAKPEYNDLFGFTLHFNGKRGMHILKIAAADCYQAYLNGDFLAAGPARTASGFSRVDEIKFTAREGENVLTILVAAYHVNTFQYAPNDGFLQTEILWENDVFAFTDENTAVFEIAERQKRVQRYSFQRAFTEIWNLGPQYSDIFTGKRVWENHRARVVKGTTLLLRRSAIPKFGRLSSVPISGGKMQAGMDYEDKPVLCSPPFLQPTPVFKAYAADQLETDLVHELRGFRTEECHAIQKDRLFSGEFGIYDLGVDGCGFIEITVKALQNSTLYILFDEILADGDVDCFRLNCINCVKYTFEKGDYHTISLEPYCLRYAKIYCSVGHVIIGNFSLIEVANPNADHFVFRNSDAGIQKIFDAALNSFQYNAVDILMDCPSRERAGWLCDGYFTGKAEHVLTGKNDIEHDFLENFILKETYEYIPDGMIPMCYPGEHLDGNYIPTWAMWYILELHRYLSDCGDKDLIMRSEKKVRQILNYLQKYENECELLENLAGWVFIEWSRAAEFTNGVNYCANMLYALSLQRAGELYADEKFLLKAQRIKTRIRSRSYNGRFFADHSIRDKNGELVLCGDISEVCQYYAFFSETATPETYPELWQTLLMDFGPRRKQENKYPQVCYANAFIGNFLRLSLLHEYGYGKQLIEECRDYFLYMANRTNTLWEHDTDTASCCHGFTSYLTYWLIGYNENKMAQK